jgi:molybdate transport system substrate-binding protein
VPDLAKAYTFPEHTHAQIVYPAALVARGDEESAKGFLEFLSGAAGQRIFADHGFKPAP